MTLQKIVRSASIVFLLTFFASSGCGDGAGDNASTGRAGE